MGTPLPIETRITEAETRWPGLQFRRKTAHEASSACPFCHQATEDGFLVFDTGAYWCRKCDAKGFIDENDTTPPDPVKILAARLAAVERLAEENAKRLTALERMARCTDHLTYYQQMNQDDMRDLWLAEGFTDETIDKWQLGICYHCKTDQPDERMSMTIPVMFKNRPVNIRHRLITSGNDRYRPHMPGLGNFLFNADDVYSDDTSSILIAEGEKKAICLKQHGLGNVVGTMGKGGFQRAWASRFDRFSEVLIALDPDATDKAREMAGWFGGKARVVSLPTKPDDFFHVYNGTPSQFNEFIKLARKVA